MVEVAPAVIARARALVDRELGACADRLRAEVPGTMGEALAYALRSPGKRVRPALVLAAYQACGGDHAGIAGIAAAVEIVHTYSLVHDDLPCMDDDPLRRGRPTTHVTFGVPVATRVGYLLVPVAAETLARAADAMALDPEVTRRMAVTLFEASGIRGMVGGQWCDLEAEGVSLDLQQLMAVHRGKTGTLIRSAVELGGLAAGAPAPVLDALRHYGEELGLAFQVADDVLDATATSDTLGKTAGKDEERSKSTYVGLLGVAEARREAVRHEVRGVAVLEGAGVSIEVLAPLARYIVTRSS